MKKNIIIPYWATSISINVIISSITAAVAFFSTIFMARTLDINVFSKIMMIVIIFNTASSIDVIRSVVIYFTGRQRYEYKYSMLFTAIYAMLVLGVCAFFIVYFVLLMFFRELFIPSESFVLAFLCALYFPMAGVWGILDGFNDTIFTGLIRNTLWAIAYISFCIIGMFGYGAVYYMYILFIFNILGFIIYLFRYLNHFFKESIYLLTIDRSLFALLLSKSKSNFLFNISTLTLGVSDKLFVGSQLGPHMLGIYTAVSELVMKSIFFMRITSLVAYPAIVNSRLESATIYRKSAKLMLIVPVVMGFFVSPAILYRNEIILAILGDRFVLSSDVFGILIGTLPIFALGFLCVTILNAQGDFATQSRYYTVFAIFYIILLHPVVNAYGLTGVSGLLFASRLVDLVLAYSVLKKMNIINYKTAYIVMSISIVAVPVISIAGSIFSIFMSILFSIFIILATNRIKVE